jgi:hypothetical protein
MSHFLLNVYSATLTSSFEGSTDSYSRKVSSVTLCSGIQRLELTGSSDILAGNYYDSLNYLQESSGIAKEY